MFNDRIEAFASAGNIRRTSRVNQLVGREPPVLVLQHGGAHHEVLGVGGARLRCRCALLRGFLPRQRTCIHSCNCVLLPSPCVRNTAPCLVRGASCIAQATLSKRFPLQPLPPSVASPACAYNAPSLDAGRSVEAQDAPGCLPLALTPVWLRRLLRPASTQHGESCPASLQVGRTDGDAGASYRRALLHNTPDAQQFALHAPRSLPWPAPTLRSSTAAAAWRSCRRQRPGRQRTAQVSPPSS